MSQATVSKIFNIGCDILHDFQITTSLKATEDECSFIIKCLILNNKEKSRK